MFPWRSVLAIASPIESSVICARAFFRDNAMHADRSTKTTQTEQTGSVPQPSHLRVNNCLLAAFPGRERQHLLTRSQKIELRLADVLCKPGERMRHVFFPRDGCISLLAPTASTALLEGGLVGNEGMFGIS